MLQELLCAIDTSPAYWEPDGGSAEVDFVVQLGGSIIPFEVKAGVNLRARSLASYRARFEPPYAVRTSLAAYEFNEGLYNIPLYAISSYVPNLPS